MVAYAVGDCVVQEAFGGVLRMVVVTERSDDVKNGQPGFTGRLATGDHAGAWGYDSQVRHVCALANPPSTWVVDASGGHTDWRKLAPCGAPTARHAGCSAHVAKPATCCVKCALRMCGMPIDAPYRTRFDPAPPVVARRVRR